MEYKIANHIVLFGQDKWIMKHIENIYPFFNKIYISYSNMPWNYNPKARASYKNSFDLNIIKSSKFNDKIIIIEGDWLTEEDQRNACVNQAKKDKMDFLFIIDPDEFYFNNDLEKIIKIIKENPNYDIYTCPWYCFWKSWDYVLINENNDKIVGYPQICINLNNDIKFERKRKPIGNKIYNINNNSICYHASYVLSNEELDEKLKTWGHHNDFNVDEWYKNIWLKWNENMENLHPVSPKAWKKAIKFDGELPEILKYLH